MSEVENHNTQSFAEKHPRLNFLMGLVLLLGLVAVAVFVVLEIFKYLGAGIKWLSSLASSVDAVIIVALITGGVSITGVLISSVVAKRIDYVKSRQEYLAKKREDPYGQFVDMIYKMQNNIKNKDSYTQEQMLEDVSKFSKQITLWGSSKVITKWVEFREKSQDPKTAQQNLLLLEDIMNEMRKDLGLKKTKKGNLLAFFINDIKTAMKKLK